MSIELTKVILDAVDIIKNEGNIPNNGMMLETVEAKTLLFIAIRELHEKYDESDANRVYKELKIYISQTINPNINDFIVYYRKKYFKILPLQ
jgi:uncharacterized protein YqgV (UPF0045/DUF77 family)